MFSNKDLRNLIFPLFVEQFLLMLVGIADTFVVSFSSEADVSGVSLVNSFNTVLIFLFTALSSGGAVIISQYIGSRNYKKADEAASQLLMISAIISVFLSAVILFFDNQILLLLFGKVEPDVMQASETYLIITTWSLPALAIYDAGAALCRSIGKTKATMYISAGTNIINIIGNCVGVFVLDLGAAGVAYSSFISRILSAAAVTIYCFNCKNKAQYKVNKIFAWDSGLIKKIMGIALPNGIENGVHQLVKVALSSMVALFGTYQIAANGVAQSIWSLASIMGLAMAPVYTTVIGRCMGARDINSANFYFKKLNKITLTLSNLLECICICHHPAYCPIFRYFRRSKITGDLACPHQQHFQWTCLPIRRSFGKWTPGGWRCKIYHAGFDFPDDCCSSVLFCTVWLVAGLGSNWCRNRYEY